MLFSSYEVKGAFNDSLNWFVEFFCLNEVGKI